MRIKKIQQEADQPYAPKISNTTRRIASKKSISMSRDPSKTKWDNLHAESKKLLHRKDADLDQKEFNLHRDQYTFQPNSGKKARSPSVQSLRPSFNHSSSSKKKLKPGLFQGR